MALPMVMAKLGQGFMAGFTTGMHIIPTDVSLASIARYSSAVAQPCLGGLAMISGDRHGSWRGLERSASWVRHQWRVSHSELWKMS